MGGDDTGSRRMRMMLAGALAMHVAGIGVFDIRLSRVFRLNSGGQRGVLAQLRHDPRHEQHRIGRGQEHDDGSGDADERELRRRRFQYGEAAHDGHAGGNEEHGHVVDEVVARLADALRLQDVRAQQHQQQHHAQDVAGKRDGQHGCQCATGCVYAHDQA